MPPPPPAGGGSVPPPPMGYTPAAGGYASRRTDGLAIGSLITGIFGVVCSFICLGILLGPAAAIRGYISRRRIAASGGPVGGGGIALAGLIVGIVGFAISGLWLFLFLIGTVTSNSFHFPSPSP